MESNPFQNARILLFVSGIGYILLAVIILLISSGRKANVRVGDAQWSANLSEMTGHPGVLTGWMLLILLPVLIGVAALWYRRKRPGQMKKPFGIVFIVVGVMTFYTGAGILLAIAGGQIIILHNAYAKGYRLRDDRQ